MESFDLLCAAELAIDEIGDARNITDNESSTLLHSLKRFYGGMGGNFSVVASLFGAKTALLASIGQKDPDSIDYKKYLKGKGIETSYLMQDEWSTMSKCFIINQDEKQRIFFYPGTAIQNPEQYLDYCKETINKIKAKALYAGSVNFELNKMCLKESEAKLKAYAPAHNTHRHTKEDLSACLHATDILFINEHESKIMEKTLDRNIFEISREYAISVIAKTLGKDGSEIIVRGNPTAIAPCPVPKVIDHSGAGDAYAGGFLASYIKTKDPIYSAKIASAVASFIVEKQGCQSNVPTMEMLKERVKRNYNLNVK